MRLLISFFLIINLFGCVVPEASHVVPDYFLLSPELIDRNSSSNNSSFSFYLKEVEIPEFLNDPRLVMRPEKLTVKFRENKRWGEPLEDGISRVLSANLASRLGTNFYSVFPNRRKKDLNWDISLTVLSFNRIGESTVEIEALWELSNSNSDLRRDRFSYSKLLDNNDSESIDSEVLALSDCLAELSVEVANEINDLVGDPGN